MIVLLLDLARIIWGKASFAILLEVVIRTVIMYCYAVFLLRLLGKRGMGQLSFLELTIIIAFGSAVGDPMIGLDIPLVYGITAISVITLLQINLERFINKNRKVERVLEGEANCLVKNSIIQTEALKKENLSHTDLFRALRIKDVEHLGQVKRAFIETSGEITVFFHPPLRIKPGLTTFPDEALKPEEFKFEGDPVLNTGHYSCYTCGETEAFDGVAVFPFCSRCRGRKWLKAVASGGQQS